ncbi:glycosyltransferase family 2 protein [Edwardsiella tarda]|uniref:glycosyltransferase family 2 protein n=1 Tax=Edwardsiella tarda TaxID=636 RepID=UPI003F659976
MCKISVVIPMYNKEGFILNCLNSVLNQSCAIDEVIIIDDGSTDNSYNVLIDFIKNNTQFKITIKRQDNAGVSAARNEGIKLSSYEYIAFLDADDEWEYTYIELMKKIIKKYPDAIAYSSSHLVRNNNGVFWKETTLERGFEGVIVDFYKASSKLSILNSSKSILKKTVINEIGGFPLNEKNGEDLFIWMEVARRGFIAHINKPLVIINQFADKSRDGRITAIPYPLKFYSATNDILSFSERKYIFILSVKSLILNKLARNRGNVLEINKMLRKVTFVGYLFSFVISCLPLQVLDKIIKKR